MDIEDGYLIDRNRPGFRKIFQHHTAVGSSHLLPFSELIKFASAVRIFPDLMSSFEMKRLVGRLTGKHTGGDSDLSITYLQFEKLVKHIAYQCFSSLDSDRLKMLLTHIRNAASLHYKVALTVETKDRVIDAPSPLVASRGESKGKKKEDTEPRKNQGGNKGTVSLQRSQEVSLPSRAKEVSSKVRQLYALISPRAASIDPRTSQPSSLTTSLRPSLTPDNPSTTMSSRVLKPSFFAFERESPILSSDRLDLHRAKPAKPSGETDRKELVESMVRVFKEFREKVTGTIVGRRAKVSDRVRKFVRTMRKYSFSRVRSRQRMVLMLSFRLWSVKTFRF